MDVTSFVNLAKKPYLSSELSRPDWTQDTCRNANLLWLDKNENIDPVLNEKLENILKNLSSTALNTYPEAAKVYKKLATKNNLSPRNLILTNGSDGAIRMVFDVFIQEGDKVLYSNPTFAMYSVYSKMFGAKSLTVDYKLIDEEPNMDVESFFSIIKEQKPKLVCLPNPDSPSGTVLTEKEMETLLLLTREAGSLLLIDEAYFPFYDKTVLPRINEFPNLLVCRTFSKAWGAAGARVGFLAANAELMNLLHKNRAMYEIGTLSLEFIDVLIDEEEEMLQSVKRLNEGKKYFQDELGAMGFKTTRTHGNFIHVNFGSEKNKIETALKNVVLFRTSFAGTCLEHHSRFSLGTKKQFEQIIEVLKSIV